MPGPDVGALLAAYDAQLRVARDDRLPAGAIRSSGTARCARSASASGGFVDYRDLGGLEGDELDALIARQVEVFARARRAVRVEAARRTTGPPTSRERLRAAGFVPEDQETVLIAPVDASPTSRALPDGVILREVTRAGRLRPDRGDGGGGLGRRPALARRQPRGGARGRSGRTHDRRRRGRRRRSSAPAGCASPPGTEFATLWGGGTLPAWRGRGIYRALVAYRANLAAERGFRYLQVDASDDSRPILERLGFVAVTTTTPFIWSPPAYGKRGAQSAESTPAASSRPMPPARNAYVISLLPGVRPSVEPSFE